MEHERNEEQNNFEEAVENQDATREPEDTSEISAEEPLPEAETTPEASPDEGEDDLDDNVDGDLDDDPEMTDPEDDGEASEETSEEKGPDNGEVDLRNEEDAETAKKSNSRTFLTFRQGNEKYALDIDIVREVLGETDETIIPLVPPYIRGVVNLRGYVIPVLDLCWLFYTRPLEVTNHTTIIVVEVNDENETYALGVMVDALDEVMNISEEDMDPAPDFGSKINAAYISGIARSEGTYTIILNGGVLFNIDRLSDFEIEEV